MVVVVSQWAPRIAAAHKLLILVAYHNILRAGRVTGRVGTVARAGPGLFDASICKAATSVFCLAGDSVVGVERHELRLTKNTRILF